MKPIKIKLTEKEKQRIIELLIQSDHFNCVNEKFDTLCAFNRIEYSILNKDK